MQRQVLIPERVFATAVAVRDAESRVTVSIDFISAADEDSARGLALLYALRLAPNGAELLDVAGCSVIDAVLALSPPHDPPPGPDYVVAASGIVEHFQQQQARREQAQTQTKEQATAYATSNASLTLKQVKEAVYGPEGTPYGDRPIDTLERLIGRLPIYGLKPGLPEQFTALLTMASTLRSLLSEETSAAAPQVAEDRCAAGL